MSKTAPETIIVTAETTRIMCDGGDQSAGHPAVYYSFDGKNHVTCGYCGRRFEKAKTPKKARKSA